MSKNLLTEKEYLALKAKELESSRSKRSQKADEKQKNKRTLPLTKENLEKWKKNPGRYDLKGIDTIKKLVRTFHKYKGLKKKVVEPKAYTQADLEAARRYLKEREWLYEDNTKYVELQTEIAKAIHQGVDPDVLDWAAHIADDISLSESMESEKEWALLEERGYT